MSAPSWTRYWDAAAQGASAGVVEVEALEAWLGELCQELVALSWLREPPRQGAWRAEPATPKQRLCLAPLRNRLHTRDIDPLHQWALSEASAREDLTRGAASDLIAILSTLERRPFPRVATTPPGRS